MRLRTAVSLSAGVVLSLNPAAFSGGITPGSYNQTVGSLGGTGGHVSIGSATLTVGTDNTNTAYAGSIDGTGGSLVKVGTGTLTLSGNNSFSGGLAVNAGTLAVPSDAAIGSSSNPVTVGPSGTLAYTESASTARTFSLNSGTLAIAAGKTLTFSGATVSGGFLTGPGTFDTTGVTTRFVVG